MEFKKDLRYKSHQMEYLKKYNNKAFAPSLKEFQLTERHKCLFGKMCFLAKECDWEHENWIVTQYDEYPYGKSDNFFSDIFSFKDLFADQQQRKELRRYFKGLDDCEDEEEYPFDEATNQQFAELLELHYQMYWVLQIAQQFLFNGGVEVGASYRKKDGLWEKI